MKELKELVRILSKTWVKRIEILQNLKQGRGKTSRFLDVARKIRIGDIYDDKTASEYLYDKPPGDAYYFFKHRLRKLLLNSLFHIDFRKTGYSDYAKAEFDCSMLRHQVYTLAAFDARNTAINIAEDMMKIAEKYELAEFMAYGASLLSRYFAMTGPKSLFVKYDTLYKEWSVREQMENNARISLNRLNIEFVGSVVQRPEMAELAFAYAKEIEKDMAIYSSWKLQYHWYRLMGTGYYIKNEYEKSILIWKQLEEYLLANPLFCSNARLGIATTEQMMNYLETRDYNKGLICAERCLGYFKPGDTNWFIFLEYFFLLCIQNQKYNHAISVYNMTVKNINLPAMPKRNREKWILNHAWLHFVNLVLDIPLSKIEGDFNLYSFLNKFDFLNKDKEGFNASMLIVDICIRIHEGDKLKLMEKMESLKTYKKRYLKKDVDYRVQAFIQLLLICEELDYQHPKIKNKSKILFSKLQLAPLINTNNFEGLEVVPFDIVWPMVLQDIKRNKLTRSVVES